jgi:hypothetical protein
MHNDTMSSWAMAGQLMKHAPPFPSFFFFFASSNTLLKRSSTTTLFWCFFGRRKRGSVLSLANRGSDMADWGKNLQRIDAGAGLAGFRLAEAHHRCIGGRSAIATR